MSDRIPIIHFLRHYADSNTDANMAATLALAMLANGYPLVAYPAALTGVATAVLGYLHHRQPCIVCAVKTPLDGGAAAERDRRWLKLMHTLTKVTLVRSTALPLRVAGVMLAGPTIAAILGFGFGITGPGSALVMFGPTIVLSVAFAKHRRLEPWCPYCKGWGGRDKETIKTPDPSPAAH